MACDESPVKDWALYVYFAVDVPQPQLYQSAIRNLAQMATIGSSSRVYVAAQIDLPGMPTRRYIMPEHGSSIVSPAVSIQNVNSADPRSLADFLVWAGQECPAKNIMLVIWGHGYGLDNYVPPGAHFYSPRVGLKSLQLVVPPAKRVNLSPTGFHPDVAEGAVSDGPSKAVTTNAQIAEAIRSSIPSLPGGKRPSIVGFASCEMAMAEVWSEMAGCAEYGIASQTGVPFQDWPLGNILGRLVRNPEQQDAEEVSKMVMDVFIESYIDEPDAAVAISAVNLSSLSDKGPLTTAVWELEEQLKPAAVDAKNLPKIFKARDYCPIFDSDGFIDLGCFCQFLRITMAQPSINDACDKVLSKLTEFVKSDFSPQDCTKKLSQSTGLSIWFPPWIEDPSIQVDEIGRSMAYLDSGYSATRFAQNTDWDEFLAVIRDTARIARKPQKRT